MDDYSVDYMLCTFVEGRKEGMHMFAQCPFSHLINIAYNVYRAAYMYVPSCYDSNNLYLVVT